MPAVKTTAMSSADYQNAVKALLSAGISESAALSFMNKARKEQVLSQHIEKYGLYDTIDRGKTVFRSWLPDEAGELKKIQSISKDKLEDKIIKHYAELEKASKKENYTLRNLYPIWYKTKAATKSVASAKRYEVSWKKYYLNEPLSQEILDTPLIMLDGIDLDIYVHSMIKKYKMNKHTYGDFSVIIRQMLHYARRKHYIVDNPFEEVYVDRKDSLTREKKKPSRVQAFKDYEADMLIDYAWEQYRKGRNNTQMFVPLAIIFMIYTGIRRSELTALEFSDIVGEDLYVSKMYAKDEKIVVERVKKGEEREIVLIPEALEIVEEVRQKKLEMGLPVDGYIFIANESHASTYSAVYKAITRYCKELGIYEHSPHDTRRTFVSQLHAKGCPGQTIMDMTGHNDYKCFENSYLYDVQGHEAKKDYLMEAFSKK